VVTYQTKPNMINLFILHF